MTLEVHQINQVNQKENEDYEFKKKKDLMENKK